MNFLPPKIRVCSFRQNYAGLVQRFHSHIAKGHVISPQSPPFPLSVRLRNRLLKSTTANDGVENDSTLPAVHVKSPKQNTPSQTESKTKASVPHINASRKSKKRVSLKSVALADTGRRNLHKHDQVTVEDIFRHGEEGHQGNSSDQQFSSSSSPADEPTKSPYRAQSTKAARGSSPRHQTPIPYTRRIEGLIQPGTCPILQDLPPPSNHRPIAKLAHGIDRVLFNPGVHWLKDPRSQVYNFSPRLELIPNVNDFAFERIAPFVKSSHDEDLWLLAKREKRNFTGSTSSLSGILSQIYFLISADREVDTSTLSRHFQREPKTFTPGQRMPASTLMRFKDGIYSFDSDPMVDLSEKNILSWMGTMLEKFLTLPEDDFVYLMRMSPPAEYPTTDNRREAYRYAKSEKFVMRSQLDCHDSRLPGTGVFDVKTRAAFPIRFDLFNYEENSGYLIRTLHGATESFEKEYYDLICSAFLKYSFQARIGNMDGVIVAYHNTARIFGFQYISLDEIDERLFGQIGRGQLVFEKCVRLLETVVEEIIEIFPDQSIRCTFETRPGKGEMDIFIEPAEWPDNDLKPIAQLSVTATNYVDGFQLPGVHAISNLEKPWTLHWAISKSSASESEIRDHLASCRVRQWRAWSLPTGVSMEEMAKRWHALDFGGKKAEGITTQVPFDPTRFKPANQATNLMRALARSGKEETEKQALLSEGVRKVVWGEPEALVEEDTEGRLNGAETAEEIFSVAPYDAPSAVSCDTASIQDVEQLADENDVLDESPANVTMDQVVSNSADSASSPSSSSAPLSFIEPSQKELRSRRLDPHSLP